MKDKSKVTPLPNRNRDYLDELIERESVDEMGLLDLIFIEEILSQEKQEKAAG